MLNLFKKCYSQSLLALNYAMYEWLRNNIQFKLYLDQCVCIRVLFNIWVWVWFDVLCYVFDTKYFLLALKYSYHWETISCRYWDQLGKLMFFLCRQIFNFMIRLNLFRNNFLANCQSKFSHFTQTYSANIKTLSRAYVTL